MRRGFTVSLVIIFALAIGCASLVAPASSLASVMPGCSQNSSGGQEECPVPSFLCDFESAQGRSAGFLPATPRSHDFFKYVSLTAAHLNGDIASRGSCLGENSRFDSVGSTPQNVSVYLFHSVLTL